MLAKKKAKLQCIPEYMEDIQREIIRVLILHPYPEFGFPDVDFTSLNRKHLNCVLKFINFRSFLKSSHWTNFKGNNLQIQCEEIIKNGYRHHPIIICKYKCGQQTVICIEDEEASSIFFYPLLQS